MIDFSSEPASVSRSVHDSEPLLLDCIVARFWTQIRALLIAGLDPADIAGILGRALSDLGHADAIASMDFTRQIEQLAAAERIFWKKSVGK